MENNNVQIVYPLLKINQPPKGGGWSAEKGIQVFLNPSYRIERRLCKVS
jgi:hypothetical protein